eukprot:5418969-Ditylum_brightwellii.AAC.1
MKAGGNSEQQISSLGFKVRLKYYLWLLGKLHQFYQLEKCRGAGAKLSIVNTCQLHRNYFFPSES